MYKKYIKRWLDILCAILALIIFWWLYLIIAFLVRIKLGSPVLFQQERPGKDEKIFKLYKFRSMTDKRDASGNLLPDDQRLSKFGRILRSTSMDELPEVFNILKGDMSIVGCAEACAGVMSKPRFGYLTILTQAFHDLQAIFVPSYSFILCGPVS